MSETREPRSEALPVGTPVMIASPHWGVMVGVVVACGQSVPSLGQDAYDVRTESGQGYYCLPAALFDLRPTASRPAICIHRVAGNV